MVSLGSSARLVVVTGEVPVWLQSVRTAGCHARAHEFLTTAQRVYVARYCKKLIEALDAEADGEHVIDMDAVADAVGKETDKPPFYYAEESQQNQFLCDACGSFNDILGKFGYCSVCGTRNDIQELAENIIEPLRRRIEDGGPYEDCVRDAVSAFDFLCRKICTGTSSSRANDTAA